MSPIYKILYTVAMTGLLIIAFACVVAWMVVIYNRLVRDRQRVKTAWSADRVAQPDRAGQ